MKKLWCALLFAATMPTLAIPSDARWQYEWPGTDFTIRAVDLSEIMSGGPPRDGIPAVDDPQFLAVADESRLGEREPVMTVEIPGEIPRAYPVRYLTWHEIVNDRIGGVAVSVTFCPLCNSGIVFDRNVDGRTFSFGVSGKLRNSDMIMYDRETESWWQQFEGRAIVGEMTGAVLDRIPAWMESWSEFAARNPEGLVMDRPSHSRPYGTNPYVGYDSLDTPFLFAGENPPHGIPPLARVVAIGDRAWPLSRFADVDEVNEDGLRISWKSGTASALDSRIIAKGRDVGSIRVRDAATGKDVAHDVSFAFAFHAFHPEGRWMLGE